MTAAAPWDDACPREAMGSHSWVELGQDLSVFSLGPFYALLRLKHPLNFSYIFRPKEKHY